MSRVKRGVTSHAKHKKVFKAAKGYYGRRKNTIRAAKQAVEKAGQYAFRDRKRKKRTFRALWIQRLNAAVRPFGLTYSRFIDGLAKSGIDGRPQGAVGSRDPRAGGVPGDRREGQGGARGLTRLARLPRSSAPDANSAGRHRARQNAVNERYMVPDSFRYLRSQTPHLALIGLLLRRLELGEEIGLAFLLDRRAELRRRRWRHMRRPRTPSSRRRSSAPRSAPR